MKIAPALRTGLALVAALAGLPALAQQTVKIGLVAEFSGPFAEYGRQMENGMKAYLAEHGDTIAGRKIEILERDTTGMQPDIAKRLSGELVQRDNVDFLAGYGLTPNAMASAPVATQAKKATIIMNAATSIITTKSPYLVRVSMTVPQSALPMAQWAAKNGIKRVYTLVADYGPGIDAEGAFKKGFTEAGGEVIDSVRVPPSTVDFAPFTQRVKDAKPDAIFIFLPAGEPSIAFMKSFAERGLREAGIKVIATGDLTDDGVIDSMGDEMLGVITAFHYSAAHDSPANRDFLKAYAKVAGDKRANFMAVAGYDGMAAIADVLTKNNGDTDGDRALAALKGWKHESPRGPIMIDADTRDIVQTEYIRRVEKKDGHLYNIEFASIPSVKDPGK